MNSRRIARKLIEIAKECLADWPSNVKEGGLRKEMGLDIEKPLSDQVSPSKVVDFFKKADKHQRGMVMFAVNSNQDDPFWKKVGDMI